MLRFGGEQIKNRRDGRSRTAMSGRDGARRGIRSCRSSNRADVEAVMSLRSKSLPVPPMAARQIGTSRSESGLVLDLASPSK